MIARITSYALILALTGCLGLGGWVLALRSANGTLTDKLRLSQIEKATCIANRLNIKKHVERVNAINSIPDSDLANAVDPSWVLPESSAD